LAVLLRPVEIRLTRSESTQPLSGRPWSRTRPIRGIRRASGSVNGNASQLGISVWHVLHASGSSHGQGRAGSWRQRAGFVPRAGPGCASRLPTKGQGSARCSADAGGALPASRMPTGTSARVWTPCRECWGQLPTATRTALLRPDEAALRRARSLLGHPPHQDAAHPNPGSGKVRLHGPGDVTWR
jgi:hypothetical protein